VEDKSNFGSDLEDKVDFVKAIRATETEEDPSEHADVIDVVMACYCTKICPKLPHNLSFIFHNSS